MAKQIKAIKCPHCGSVNKTKLDNDLYHCENCNTDYFLDNDDVNININHKSEEKQITSNIKPFHIFGGIIAGILFISVLTNLFSTKTTAPRHVVNTGTSTAPVPTTSPPKPKPNTFRFSSEYYYPLIINDNEIISVSIGYRSYDREGQTLNGYYFEVKDLLSNKILREEQIKSAGFKQRFGRDNDWMSQGFSDGNVYLSFSNRVYLISHSDLTISDISENLFSKHEEFDSGIADVSLTLSKDDSLRVLTNNGKEYFYWPLSNKIFNARHSGPDYSKLIEYRKELEYKKNNASEPYIRTSFQFNKSQYTGKIHLIKVIYKTSNISDNRLFDVKFTDETDNTYKITFARNNGPLIESKNLTNDRQFFYASVLYSTDNELILRSKMNASPLSLYNLQSIDVNTGEVKWTLKGSDKYDFSSLEVSNNSNIGKHNVVVPYGKGYLLQLHGKYLLVDHDGKITKEIGF